MRHSLPLPSLSSPKNQFSLSPVPSNPKRVLTIWLIIRRNFRILLTATKDKLTSTRSKRKTLSQTTLVWVTTICQGQSSMRFRSSKRCLNRAFLLVKIWKAHTLTRWPTSSKAVCQREHLNLCSTPSSSSSSRDSRLLRPWVALLARAWLLLP